MIIYYSTDREPFCFSIMLIPLSLLTIINYKYTSEELHKMEVYYSRIGGSEKTNHQYDDSITEPTEFGKDRAYVVSVSNRWVPASGYHKECPCVQKFNGEKYYNDACFIH